MADDAGIPRLDLLKALGDNTRYAIYLELARSPMPLATADIAETLGLHPNTVRPHLERMREVGLLEVRPRSAPPWVGPQHLYSLATAAPSLGLEPPTFPCWPACCVRLAEAGRRRREDAADVGREQGRLDAALYAGAASCLEALVDRLDRLGFDPRSTARDDGETAVIGSPTARSASWPRPTPTSSAGCTAASSRASSRPWATPTSSTSTRSSTATPAR